MAVKKGDSVFSREESSEKLCNPKPSALNMQYIQATLGGLNRLFMYMMVSNEEVMNSESGSGGIEVEEREE